MVRVRVAGQVMDQPVFTSDKKKKVRVRSKNSDLFCHVWLQANFYHWISQQ